MNFTRHTNVAHATSPIQVFHNPCKDEAENWVLSIQQSTKLVNYLVISIV